MYILQYWNQAAAEWRGAGFTSNDIESARQRMRNSAEQCGYCVQFRILQQAAVA